MPCRIVEDHPHKVEEGGNFARPEKIEAQASQNMMNTTSRVCSLRAGNADFKATHLLVCVVTIFLHVRWAIVNLV